MTSFIFGVILGNIFAYLLNLSFRKDTPSRVSFDLKQIYRVELDILERLQHFDKETIDSYIDDLIIQKKQLIENLDCMEK